MSGQRYGDYEERLRGYSSLSDDKVDEATRRRAEDERAKRVSHARSAITRGEVTSPPPARDHRRVYDARSVRKAITKPSVSAKRLHVVLVDNSGSNQAIAEHLKRSSGHFLAMLKLVDPESEVAWIYFSDHCDGADGLMQEVDYVAPDPEGEKVMISTIEHVRNASGGDEAEAIECAIWRACELDYGEVAKENRHLYLVTDMVAHGMGLRDDAGCPVQRDWRKSLARAERTFGSFEVVGSGADPEVAKLQEQFVSKERLAFDLIDLSEIRNQQHRNAITGNAPLFLMARTRGKQTVTAFLMALYEKWLSEPIFGGNTDMAARTAIRRFAKYLEFSQAEIDKIMAGVVA